MERAFLEVAYARWCAGAGRPRRGAVAAGEKPDVVLATSMVNLPAWLALLPRRPRLARVPCVLYMHENQLTYPPPPGTKRDLAYGMIQHLSMLAADRVCFNSAYHLKSWFAELPRLLKHFPDYTHLESGRRFARPLPGPARGLRPATTGTAHGCGGRQHATAATRRRSSRRATAAVEPALGVR